MTTHFDNFSDFLAHAEQTSHWNSAEHGSRRIGGAEFRGTGSFREAVELARNGWQDGRAAVEAARAHFADILGSRIRRAVLSHDVRGFSPDVGAYLAGEPENMFSHEETEVEAQGKIIRIVVNGSASGGIKAEAIIRRGAFIVALVDKLESLGYSVELTAAFPAVDAGYTAGPIIVAKCAGEPVEIDRLAFCIAHPSMLRRLVFSCLEQDEVLMRAAGYSFGSCGNICDTGDLYIPPSDLRVITDGNAVAWIRSHLAPLGITFDE